MMYSDLGEVPEEEYLIPIGKAEVVRTGKDITIVSFNKMMKVAKESADALAKEGIEAEVIDLRTIRPLDFPTIVESVKKTNRIVIIDESWPFGSISSEISFQIQKHAFDYLDAPVKRVCQRETPMPYSKVLEYESLPNKERIVKAVLEVLS